MKFSAWGQSECGQFRENNEDSWAIDVESGLYVIADGMGGHLGGEVASEMVVDILQEILAGDEDPDETCVASADSLGDRGELVSERLRYAINQASVQVRRTSEQQVNLTGMGTTVVVLLVDGTHGFVAHVGDSRAYLLREGALTRLTRDHTVVQEEIDAGRLTAEVARALPTRGMLTRSVGFHGRVEPDIRELALQAGDRLLLCTDGITDALDDTRLAQILSDVSHRQSATDQLITEAYRGGSEDNCTVVVIDVG